MSNIKNIAALSFLLIGCMILIHSCKKDEALPDNPYDGVDYGTNNPVTPPDPNSIVGIHKNILFPKCAHSGCHDGNFEPDFRTVESSYATLVYHKIVKNNAAGDFTFRVVPYDTAQSVLHERLTNCFFSNTDPQSCDRMPQDIIGVPLPDEDIQNIVNWIMSGAKDMFGSSPTYPNAEPKILYYIATDPGYALNYGADTNRIDSINYNPFYAPDSATMIMAFFVDDDSTSVANMQVNTMKISNDPDDYSSATSYPATYIYVNPSTQFHQVSLNTATLPKGDTLFFRYFINDGDHTNNTQFPTDNLVIQYKTYYSFFIKP